MNKLTSALVAIIALTAIFVIPTIYTPALVWASTTRGHHRPPPSIRSTCIGSVSRNGFTFSFSGSISGSCSTSGVTSGAVAEIGIIGGKSSCSSSSASQSSSAFTGSSNNNGAVSCSSHSP
jgi:hypothetical protein